jgi:uncharacterized protein (TIGR02147 family)
MIWIFDYLNYRKFLNDFYKNKKLLKSTYSFQVLSDAAGFKDKSCIYSVVRGTRNLSKSALFKVSKALKLNKKEHEYFENLVHFNQAKSPEEQKYFYDRMMAVKNDGKRSVNAHVLRKDQYEYYSKWHHAVIRSLIEMYGFDGDFKKLAKRISPPILPKQAKKSVALLERLELIGRDTRGRYYAGNKTITSGQDPLGPAVLNFNLEAMKLADKAARRLPRTERQVTGLTLGISKKTYEAVCGEILDFQDRLLKMAEEDQAADSVYQLNFQFFPLTRNSNSGSIS